MLVVNGIPSYYKTLSQYMNIILHYIEVLYSENCVEKILMIGICWKKKFTTFHAFNMVLQQQYRAYQYTKYSHLSACLLVAEKNNELLTKNHHANLTSTKLVFKVNAISHNCDGQL